MRNVRTWRLGWRAVAGIAVVCAASIVVAQQPLTSLRFQVAGVRLRPTPEQLQVPKSIPGSLAVTLETHAEVNATAFDAEGNYIEAILRGPGVPARPLYAAPGDPLLLPPLHVVGDYLIDNIRLVDRATGATRLMASPASVPVHVFPQAMVAQVTSRPLKLEELVERGVVIDDSSFRAVEFEAVFTLAAGRVPVRFPVVAPRFTQTTEIIPAAELEERLAEAERINREIMESVELPPELEAARLNIDVGVINFQPVAAEEEGDLELRIPPIPALIVIPGNIGFLNQFFSVQVFVSNASPLGSGLDVRDVAATLNLPLGPDRSAGTYQAPGDDPLRLARIGPNAEQRSLLAVNHPGLDAGDPTDDRTWLDPGDTGRAEFVVEGLREGLHQLDIALAANLNGLAAGPVRIHGRAAGTVLVRNPKFSITFAHPRVVRAGEPYTASVTVLNTSSVEANLVSVQLADASLSGAVLMSPNTVELGNIAGGESRTATYRVRSQRTGAVKFSNLSGDVDGRFQLSMGIDERGVALSPDVIGYPNHVEALPEGLRAAADRVLGQALSAATAALLPVGVERVARQAVLQHTVELAEAGQRLRYGDGAARVLTDLMLDWQGGRHVDAGFDQIVRSTDAGREWRVALISALAAARDVSATDGLADAAADLAGRAEAWNLWASDHAALLPTVQFEEEIADVNRSTIAGVAGYEGAKGPWLASRVTLPAPIWRVSDAVTRAAVTHLRLTSAGTGELRRFDLRNLEVGDCLRHDDDVLIVDRGCNGNVDERLTGALERVRERAPELISMMQDTSVRVARPPPCLPPSYQNYGTVLGVLYSKPMRQADVDAPSAYRLDDGNHALSVQIQPGGRVALLHLKKGVGVHRPRTLSLGGIADVHGNRMASVTRAVQLVANQGVAIAGRTIGVDGAPAAGIPVTLTMYDLMATPTGCDSVTIRLAQVLTDTNGRFGFDFVMAGASYSLSATDTRPLQGDLNDLLALTSRDGAVDGAELIARARELGQEDAVLQALDAANSGQAMVAIEGLDRAVMRDGVTVDSARIGTEVPVVLRFRGRGSVRGTVFAPDGVTPMADVAVNLYPDEGSRELGRGVFTTSAGTFSFPGVPLGYFHLEAQAPDGRRRSVAGYLGRVGEDHVLDINLAPEPQRDTTLRGRVFEADGVTPHAGAQIYVRDDKGQVVAHAEAGADGVFESTRVPLGLWGVAAVSFDGKRSAARSAVQTSLTAPQYVTLTLPARSEVYGRVERADGSPVAGAFVAGGQSLVTTASDGSFELVGVPIGRRNLSAGLPASGDRFARIASTSVDVLPGVRNYAVIRFSAAGRIAGQVTDAAGRPVSGVNVAIPGDLGFRWTTADEEGRYHFDDMAVGSYFVSAPAPQVDRSPEEIQEALRNAQTEDEVRAAIGDVFARYAEHSPDFDPGAWGYARATIAADGDVARADIRYLPSSSFSGTTVNARGTPIGAAVRLTGYGPGKKGELSYKIRGEVNSDPGRGEFRFADGALVGPWTLQAASPFFTRVITQSGTTYRTAPDVTGIVLQFPPQEETHGRLRGLVVSALGQPVAEARVHISLSADYEIRTDGAGRFDTQIDLAANVYEVTATDAERRQGQVLARVVAGVTNEVTVRILDNTGRLNVRVEQGGQPVDAADVTITGGDFPYISRMDVSDDGVVAFPSLYEGRYSVQACRSTSTARFCGTAGATVSAAGITTATVVLGDTASIAGSFVEADGTTPVGQAQIQIGSMGFATTDEFGLFRVDGWPFGQYVITGYSAVTGRYATATVRLRVAGEVASVLLRQQALGEVSGVVIDSDGLTRVGDAEIALQAAGVEQVATTDGQGSFQFPAVPPGDVAVRAVHSVTRISGSTRDTMPDPPTHLELTVRLEPRATVRGEVLEPDGTTPAPSVQVWTGGRRTTTDNNGRFILPDLILGRRRVVAQPIDSARSRSSASLAIEVREPGVAEAIRLTLSGTGFVTGNVLSATGERVAGAEVRLRSAAPDLEPFEDTVVSGAEGNFSCANVGLGRFELWARSGLLAARANGTIEAANARRDVPLTLGPAGNVSGTVVTEDLSESVPNAHVVIAFSGQAEGAPSQIATSTDARGRFEFEAIPHGRITVSVDAPAVDGVARVRAEHNQTATIVANAALSAAERVIAVDQSDPVIVSIVPVDGTGDAPTATDIRVTFSEAMDTLSLDSDAQFLTGPNGPVNTRLSLVEDAESGEPRTVVMRPEQRLASSTEYQVVVIAGELLSAGGGVLATGITDLAGRALRDPSITRFTTRDEIPPQLLSLSPAHGAEQLDPTAVVRASFNEPVTLAAATLTLRGPQGAVAGRIDLGLEGRLIVFTPESSLPPNATYSATLDGVRDIAGNAALNQPFITTFATIDTEGPVIRTLALAGGAQSSAGALVVVEATLAAPEVNATLRVTREQTVLVGHSDPNVMRVPLRLPEAGRLVLDGEAIDRFGNRGSATRLTLDVTPNAPPTVTVAQVAPASGPVPSGTDLRIRIAASDESGLKEVLASAAGVVSGRQQATTSPLDWTLTVPTTAGPGSITVSAQAVDNSDVASDVQELVMPVSDGVAPVVAIASPARGAEVRPGTTLNVEVEASDAFGVTRLELRTTGAVTRTQTVTLEAAETSVARTLEVVVPATATAGAPLTLFGQAWDASGQTHTVQTSLTIEDIEPPSVRSVSPADGARFVLRNTRVRLVFSEALAPATVSASSVTLSRGSAQVALAADDREVTITPSAELDYNATYTVTVSTAVTDRKGNALASAFRSSFTTLPPDLAGAQIVRITPAADEVDVSLTARIRAEFDEPLAPATVNNDTLQVQDATGNVLPFSVTLADSDRTVVATLPADRSLSLNSIYTIVLHGTPRDVAGNAALDASGVPFSEVRQTFTTLNVSIAGAPPRAAEQRWLPLEIRAPESVTLTRVDWYINGEHAFTEVRPPFQGPVPLPPSIMSDLPEVYNPVVTRALEAALAEGLAPDPFSVIIGARVLGWGLPGWMKLAPVTIELLPAALDFDGDTLSNGLEAELGTNLEVDDTATDADGDGWTLLAEVSASTNPFARDSDGDGADDAQDPDPASGNRIPAAGSTQTASSGIHCAYSAGFQSGGHARVPRTVRVPYPVTVEMWVWPEQSGVLLSSGSTRAIEIGWDAATELFSFAVGTADGNQTLQGQRRAEQRRWHHLAWSYDGQMVRGFVNGRLEASAEHSGALNYGERDDFVLGGRCEVPVCMMERTINPGQLGQATCNPLACALTQSFSGRLEEVRIWRQVRLLDTLNAHMHGQVRGDEAGLVAAWSFNDYYEWRPDRTPAHNDLVRPDGPSAGSTSCVGMPLVGAMRAALPYPPPASIWEPLRLLGVDLDGDRLTYVVSQMPRGGRIFWGYGYGAHDEARDAVTAVPATAPADRDHLVYKPFPGFVGTDEVRYFARDAVSGKQSLETVIQITIPAGRTWRGGDSADPTGALVVANWGPEGPPQPPNPATLTTTRDTVLVPSSAPYAIDVSRAALPANVKHVDALTLAPGSEAILGTETIGVLRAIFADGALVRTTSDGARAGRVALGSPQWGDQFSSTMRGLLPNLFLDRPSSVLGPTEVFGDVVTSSESGGNMVTAWDPGSFRTRIHGMLTVGQVIWMRSPAAVLEIDGNVTMGGVDGVEWRANLEAGEMRIGGNMIVPGSRVHNPRWNATYRTVFNGTQRQYVAMSPGLGNILRDARVERGSDVHVQSVLVATGSVEVLGALTVPAGAAFFINGTLVLRTGALLTNAGTIARQGGEPVACMKEPGVTIVGVDPCP